jgi:hypothetical protein
MGYADRSYLDCLADIGEPVWLPHSGAGFLSRAIPGSTRRDARGAYPLFSCSTWAALPEELAESDHLAGHVSLIAVADPLAETDPILLAKAFPDCFHPYKEHFVRTLNRPYAGPSAEGHRRNLAKALRLVEVERLPHAGLFLREWCELYRELTAAKGIRGEAAFSEESFRRQLALPALHAFRAVFEGQTVAMSLWMADGDRAYYHLGAASEQGYRTRAPFALFDEALRHFSKEGFEAALLGAGSGAWGDPHDGLSRFKAGWANASRPAFLCGRILDAEAYSCLSRGAPGGFFPAYRDPRASGVAQTAA